MSSSGLSARNIGVPGNCRCWLHLAASVLLALCCTTDALEPSRVQGAPFPIGSVLILASSTAVAAVLVGSLGMWKSNLVEHVVESIFEHLGRTIGRHPLGVASFSIFLALMCSAGMKLQESELDPSKLWVPRGSLVLDNEEYVSRTWPAGAYPDVYMAIPEDGVAGVAGVNMLTPHMIQSVFRDYQKLLAIKVDGDEIVRTNGNKFSLEYNGSWTFIGSGGNRKTCFESWANYCTTRSILAIFDHDPVQIASLTVDEIKSRIRQFQAAPANSHVYGNVWKTFDIREILGGVSRNPDGDIIGAEVLRFVMLSKQLLNEVKVRPGDRAALVDPISALWAADAVCVLGFEDKHPYSKEPCLDPAGVHYSGLFSRSFGDEFGDTIRSDIKNIIIAYFLIIIYLCVNLGKRDAVHSMLALSFGSVLCIGLSYAIANGLGGLLQVRTNPLNNNIPFLLLGLGVDDSFVLAAEFTRHSLEDCHLSIEDRIAKTAKSGGMSVLVTSVTDALAFLVGASTSLPALSAFCIYAGLGVIACFLMELFVFLPLLALNARRTAANRLDCVCCAKADQEHLLEAPQGCCPCVPMCARIQPGDGFTQRALAAFARAIASTRLGRTVTLLVFSAAFVMGFVGLTLMETEFKLEWFFPANSYVQEYYDLNSQYFDRGVVFNVYERGVDYFQKQQAMNDMRTYLTIQHFIYAESVQNWWSAFQIYFQDAGNNCQVATSEQFYACVWKWYSGITGEPHRRNIQWASTACNAFNLVDCNPAQGIAAARVPATLKSFHNGLYRYNVLRTMREDLKLIFADDGAVFPHSRSFQTWEENGVIQEELIRNLIIACGIIAAIICMLIPNVRIAILAIVAICTSVVEIVGFAYFWGLTFNGVTTIYVLICVGLAVDYSAHIAHAFKDSTGVSSDRAVKALTRIGPSVLQAVVSTLLAVAVLGFSQSYVFTVFFKLLFLVAVLAGSHGLWLLPALLSLLGGNRLAPEEQPMAVHSLKLVEEQPIYPLPVGVPEVRAEVEGDTPVELPEVAQVCDSSKAQGHSLVSVQVGDNAEPDSPVFDRGGQIDATCTAEGGVQTGSGQAARAKPSKKRTTGSVRSKSGKAGARHSSVKSAVNVPSDRASRMRPSV